MGISKVSVIPGTTQLCIRPGGWGCPADRQAVCREHPEVRKSRKHEWRPSEYRGRIALAYLYIKPAEACVCYVCALGDESSSQHGGSTHNHIYPIKLFV